MGEKEKRQTDTVVIKTQNRKPNIEQHKFHKKLGGISGVPDG